MDRRPHRGEALGEAFVRRLADWFARARRDLPWRRTRDPYRIWLSETMLQQTRVDTVISYYERFVADFPTVDALAGATKRTCSRLWYGLGYYARARNLHAPPQEVARDHGGGCPRRRRRWRSLPGVGELHGRALQSIAFGEPRGAVDGDVRARAGPLLAGEAYSPTRRANRDAAAELVRVRHAGGCEPGADGAGGDTVRPARPTVRRVPAAGSLPGAGARAAGRAAGAAFRRRGYRTDVWTAAAVISARADPPAAAPLAGPARRAVGDPERRGRPAPGAGRAAYANARAAPSRARRWARPATCSRHIDLTLDVARSTTEADVSRRAPRDARLCNDDELDELPLSRLMKKASPCPPRVYCSPVEVVGGCGRERAQRRRRCLPRGDGGRRPARAHAVAPQPTTASPCRSRPRARGDPRARRDRERQGPFDVRDSDEVMEGCVPGLDPRVLRRLRRGEFTPQADLDLHGSDAATARVLVEAFVVESHGRGLRCLRIVHGRGRRSPNGEAVLKPSLPRWLARGPARLIVLAYTRGPVRRRRRHVLRPPRARARRRRPQKR